MSFVFFTISRLVAAMNGIASRPLLTNLSIPFLIASSGFSRSPVGPPLSLPNNFFPISNPLKGAEMNFFMFLKGDVKLSFRESIPFEIPSKGALTELTIFSLSDSRPVLRSPIRPFLPLESFTSFPRVSILVLSFSITSLRDLSLDSGIFLFYSFVFIGNMLL